MGRPTTGVYEVSAPDGEVLGVARASSAGQALRRVNELCGVPCTVLGRRVFFAEQHRHACAGQWQVRSVRLSVKAANLLTRNYVADGPIAVFVAQPPRRPRERHATVTFIHRSRDNLEQGSVDEPGMPHAELWQHHAWTAPSRARW